ncbi:MAG: hypothetical protein DRJ69_00815, partial [Thermoprotei archaeon]
MLRPARMVKLCFAVLEDYVDDVLRALGKLGVLQFIDFSTTAHEFEGVASPVGVSEEFVSKVASLTARLESILSAIGEVKVEARQMPVKSGPSMKVVADIEKKLSELEAAYAEVKDKPEEAKKFVEEKGPELYVLRELLEVERRVHDVKVACGKAGRMFIIQGWAPETRASEVVKTVAEASEGLYLYEEARAEARHGGHEHGGEQPPTHIEHRNFLTRDYQPFVTAFGYPSYHEIDPTAIMAITFPIWFGFMFGDVGHGILLLIGGLYFYWLKRSGTKVPDLLDPVVKGSELLIMCAISSIIVGYLFYGAFFGSHEWFKLIYPGKPIATPAGYEYLAEEVNCPIPLGSLHHPLFVLKLSIYIAFFQIILGLLLDFFNKASSGEVKHAVLGPGLWLWLYGTLAGLFIAYDMNPTTRIGTFLRDLFAFNVEELGLPLPIPPLMLILIPFVIMILARMLFEEPIEGFGSSLEALAASVSNTVSYARIFAFFLVHHAIAELGLFAGIELRHELVVHGSYGAAGLAVIIFVLATTLIMT